MNLSKSLISVLENKMNLAFIPSLEQSTLVHIAITLWSQDDIKDLMSKFPLHTLHYNWQEIEKAVIEKSFNLQLPKRLNEKLFGFILRVGLQILSWVDFHHCKYSFVTELPSMFVWTSLGTINNVKTAKLLVMSGNLDHDTSFALACMYCLENEIEYCWNMVSIPQIKNKFNSMSFVMHWICYMYEFKKKKMLFRYSAYLLIPHISFIHEATKNGNEAATRYFFNVNVEESYVYLAFLTKVVAFELYKLEEVTSLQRYSDIMLFLLSKMNVEQQTNTIVNHTYAFLKCLLIWPWHSLLLEMAKDKWNLLSKNEYSNLLSNMVDLMRYEHNLHKLFEEFWQQSPKAYKQFFTEQGNIVYLLIGLYKTGDEKNVKLVLKDSSILTRKNILDIRNKPIFIYLVSSKKWDSIEFLIQECLSSLEDLIRFRDEFKNHVQELLSGNESYKGSYSKFEFTEECKWDKFFQLINGCIVEYNKNKRSIDDDSTSSKKHWCKGISE